MGYIAILSLIPLFIEIGRIKDFFYYKKGKRPDPPESMSRYPILCIAAIIISVQTLSTNYIFLNLLNIYRIQSYPESTIFCHVSLYNDVDEVIYPCEVIKDKDEDGTYYFLKKIFIPNSELDLSDEDILNIARKINNMPRKALGYRTPLEVFENNLKKKGIDTSFLDIYRIKLPKCLAA